MLSTPVTVAYGDGIGPEIMEASLFVLRESGAELEIETIEIGQRIYNMGAPTGILPSAYNTLRRTRVLLKGPVIVPEHEYFHDLTAALREKFQLHTMHPLYLENNSQSPHAVAYINEQLALFEPVQNALPIPKKNTSNPIPMLMAATAMLEHVGQVRLAHAIRQSINEVRKKDENLDSQAFAESVVQQLPAFTRSCITQPVE